MTPAHVSFFSLPAHTRLPHLIGTKKERKKERKGNDQHINRCLAFFIHSRAHHPQLHLVGGNGRPSVGRGTHIWTHLIEEKNGRRKKRTNMMKAKCDVDGEFYQRECREPEPTSTGLAASASACTSTFIFYFFSLSAFTFPASPPFFLLFLFWAA